MIYFISPYLKYSGNISTISRISKYFNNSKIIFTNQIQNINFNSDDLIIGLHAFKSGKYLIDRKLNFYIIIGGTDLNCDFFDSEKKEIILKVLNQSKKIIVFNQYQKEILLNLEFNDKIHIIPQSIGNLEIDKDFNLKEYLNIDSNQKVFLIVGNLRRIKDPFFLLDSFKYFYQKYNDNFVYIGNNLDSFEVNYNWIHHINGLDQNSTYAAIKSCNGLINTSISEGMSITILEAMKLGVPVYARINNSNEFIIQNNINGFLFKTVSEFNKIFEINRNKNIEKIINTASSMVNEIYNLENEKKAYLEII